MIAIIACFLLMPVKVLASLTSFLYVAAIGLECLYIVVSSKRIKRRQLDVGLLAASGALILFLVARCFGGLGQGGERIVQTLLFLLTLITFSRYQWDSRSVSVLYRALAVVMVACMAYWFVSGRIANYYSAFYGHSNGFAVVILATVAVTILDGRRGMKASHWFTLLLCAVLLSLANSRSAFLTVGVFLLLFVLFGRCRVSGKGIVAHGAFVCVLVGVLVFSTVYPSLYGTDLGFQLESLSREYFNKNFFSGREVVWKMVLEAVRGNEFFGLGLQMTPSMIYYTAFSSHNLYLQTILQSGVIGLALLLLLLWTILNRFSDLSDYPSRLGSALIIAMLVHECLEVALTQNNFTYGLMIWAIWGICLAIGGIKGAQPAFASNVHQEMGAS